MNRCPQEFHRTFFWAARHSLDLLVTKIGVFTFGASESYSMEEAAQADRGARKACGVPSGVNNILVANKVTVPGRITTTLVEESLGF